MQGGHVTALQTPSVLAIKIPFETPLVSFVADPTVYFVSTRGEVCEVEEGIVLPVEERVAYSTEVIEHEEVITPEPSPKDSAVFYSWIPGFDPLKSAVKSARKRIQTLPGPFIERFTQFLAAITIYFERFYGSGRSYIAYPDDGEGTSCFAAFWRSPKIHCLTQKTEEAECSVIPFFCCTGIRFNRVPSAFNSPIF